MFDTLKLKIPYSKNLKLDKMIRTESFLPDAPEAKIKYYYPRESGFYIAYRENEDFFTIEFSAKILKSKYLDGINPTNIAEIETKLLKTGIVTDTEPLNTCEVFRIDYTLNLKTKYVTDLIRMLRENAHWGRKYIDRRFADSTIFYNTREIFLAYNKYQEVRKKWTEGNFDQLGIPKINFSNLLRLEYRPKKLDVIRKNKLIANKNFHTETNPILSELCTNYIDTYRKKLESIKYATVEPIQDFSSFLFGDGGKNLNSKLKILGLYSYLKTIGFDEKVFNEETDKILLKSEKSKLRSKLKSFSTTALNETKNLEYIKERFIELYNLELNKIEKEYG